MKHIPLLFLIPLVLLCSAPASFPLRGAGPLPAETISPHQIVSLEEIFDQNEIFLKEVWAMAAADGFIYYLDRTRGRIFQVADHTWKLTRVISQKGSGPGELEFPTGMTARNRRIAVFDLHYNGVKVFDDAGRLTVEFRLPPAAPNLASIGTRPIAADRAGNILIRNIDYTSKTLLSVCDPAGKPLRKLLPLTVTETENMEKWCAETDFHMLVDSTDHLLLLYRAEGLLRKLNPAGQTVWETNLYDQLPKNRRQGGFRKFSQKGRDKTVTTVIDFAFAALMDNDMIYVQSRNNGTVYDSGGAARRRFEFPPDFSAGGFGVICGNRLITPTHVVSLPPAPPARKTLR